VPIVPSVKSLDAKLARIRADPSCRDFILADAKDADMGLGIAAPGANTSSSRFPFRSLLEYRDLMREIVRQGLVDIMLMSPSSSELLAVDEQLFAESRVTPAARANDATDIWLGQSGAYSAQPSRPFQSGSISQIQFGSTTTSGRAASVDLGLYSVTFNNDALFDRDALERYREFRGMAEQSGFRHFLEVFAPNAPVNPIADVARFVNDSIARMLAGVVRSARPIFLKMPYFGPGPLEALVHYDNSLIVGILGGIAGTTHDSFQLLAESKKYGAKAALFGRKINQAEDQLSLVRLLRAVADDQMAPAEATRAYHADLERSRIQPRRPLEDDLRLTDPALQ